MLAVVAVDPVAVPSSEAERAVPALAAFPRRHEVILACTARTTGEIGRLMAALRGALPRFRFVALVAESTGTRPVDIHLLRDLLDEGAVPVVMVLAAAAVPVAASLAAIVDADALLRLADGPDGVTLQMRVYCRAG